MEYTITQKEFELFSSLVYQESGISLTDKKKTLLVSRLSKRLKSLHLDSFQSYYEYILAEKDGKEFIQLLDLVSTNKTDFFREPKHFDFLREKILPSLEPVKQVRIWSSASSSGEEPYTIAMTLHDGVAGPSRWNFKILASDISTRVLASAQAGIYDQERVKNLSPNLVRRHFLKGRGAGEGTVRAKSHLCDMLTFRRINLMSDRFPIKTPLDLIFCRNVMIYFDRPTQERLMAKMYRYLKPGGYLFIGHSESLQWVEHSFKYIAPTIYQKEV